jgi:hypothetical protein
VTTPSDTWRPSPARPDCACLGEDADAALAAIRRASHTDSLVDESHFMVCILRCSACGQLFLDIFTELIDWSGGDDSQAWMYVPINDSEARWLRAAGPAADDRFLLAMKIHRRFLSRVYPRGMDPRVTWGTGPLVILPHD